MKSVFTSSARNLAVMTALTLPGLLLTAGVKPVNADGIWSATGYSIAASPGNYASGGSYLNESATSGGSPSGTAISNFADAINEVTEFAVGNWNVERDSYWFGGNQVTHSYNVTYNSTVSGVVGPAKTTAATSVASAAAGSSHIEDSGASYNDSNSEGPFIQVGDSTSVPYYGKFQVSTTADESDDSGTDPKTEQEETPGTDQSEATASASCSISIQDPLHP